MEGEYYSDLCALIVYSVQVLVGGVERGEGGGGMEITDRYCGG